MAPGDARGLSRCFGQWHGPCHQEEKGSHLVCRAKPGHRLGRCTASHITTHPSELQTGDSSTTDCWITDREDAQIKALGVCGC
jgi:hypothetical protein